MYSPLDTKVVGDGRRYNVIEWCSRSWRLLSDLIRLNRGGKTAVSGWARREGGEKRRWRWRVAMPLDWRPSDDESDPRDDQPGPPITIEDMNFSMP